MKIQNLYITERFKIINLVGSGYKGYETEFDNYALVKVQKNGRIKDVQNSNYYKPFDNVGKYILNSECSIPFSWFSDKEDMEKDEVLKIFDGVTKVLKFKNKNYSNGGNKYV